MANMTRARPTSPMMKPRSELDRVFEDVFGEREDNGEAATALWAPRMDLVENDDAYVAEFDLPGINREDITVNFENGTLSISGERKEERSEEKENYRRIERLFGRFYRSFRLPREVNEDNVEASFKDGVLSVRIRKAEKARPREIEIR